MKELQVIKETEILGKKIALYGTVENPLFKADDVANWIEHSNSRMMLKSVDESEKCKLEFSTVNNAYSREKNLISESWFVTEDGLYEICMSSRKQIAKDMKKEIKLYLKQIRLTGGAVQLDRESEFVTNYFPSFAEETKLGMVQDLLKANAEYRQKIADQEPIVKAYKDLMTAQGYLQFIDVAAMVEIGRTKLMEFLRDKKVLTKQSIYNVPYGRFAKPSTGMFKVITEESEKGYISSVTMVSPKGLNYIYKLIKKNNMLDEFNTTPLLEVSENA